MDHEGEGSPDWDSLKPQNPMVGRKASGARCRGGSLLCPDPAIESGQTSKMLPRGLCVPEFSELPGWEQHGQESQGR